MRVKTQHLPWFHKSRPKDLRANVFGKDDCGRRDINHLVWPVPEGELAPPAANPGEVFTPYIDDFGLTLRRHTIDLRVLELGIFPTVVLGPSVSVSHYDFGCCLPPDTSASQTPSNIEQYKFNVPNLPLFAQGSEPFLGDYIEVVPSPLFVPSGNGWAYNFKPSVNPLFHATWTDNRDVVPPANGNWKNYTPPIIAGTTGTQMSIFEPGQTLPACQPGQEGMRNQNIYTAQISGGLVVGSPGNAKPLGTTTFTNPATGVSSVVPFQRAFAVEAQNITGQQIFVRLTIANQPTGGSASFLQFSPLTTLDITIPQYSSVSRSVFVTSTNPLANVTVNVAQIAAIGGSVVTNGLSATAVLNPDATNPNIQNPNVQNAEVTDPNIGNPHIGNPNVQNPNIGNPNVQNPNIQNPDTPNPNIQNPNIGNPNVQNNVIEDVIYPMTNNGNTTATYTVQVAEASSAAVPGGIVVQLILNKLYQTPMAQSCELGLETHWVTVANIINPKLYSPGVAGLGNPNIQNPAPNEASVTLAPGETVYVTLRVQNPEQTAEQRQFNPITAIAPVTVPQAVNTTTVLLNPGNTNLTGPVVYPHLTITTPSLPPTDPNDPNYSVQLMSTGGKPGADTWNVVGETAPPPGLTLSSSGLLSGAAITPGSYTFGIQVADSAIPANTAVQNFTVNVSTALLSVQLVEAPADGVVNQQYVATPLTATGGTAPYVYTAMNLPAGLSINPNTGQIGGTPTVVNPSGNSVTITATDAAVPAESVSTVALIRVFASPLNVTFVRQPPNYQGGLANPNSPVVVHVASSNLPVVGASVTLSFNGTPPCTSATLGGTLTQPTQADGNATFTNLSVDRGQIGYTLAASVDGNSAISHLYDPTAGTFTATGSMAQARATVSAVLLADGRVLVSGGVGVSGELSSSEIFDPATGTFSATGSLNVARARHTMTLLPNGKVLVAGGRTFSGPPITVFASAEIFDPNANGGVGAFTVTANMNSPRDEARAVLLSNGDVLIAGGFVSYQTNLSSATADIFNPATNSFTLSANNMSVARAHPAATGLPDGTVLVAGGVPDTGATTPSTASADIFTLATGTFATTGAMSAPREYAAAVILPTGNVLVSGGDDGVTTTSTQEIYYSTAPLAPMVVTTTTIGQPATTVYSNPEPFSGATSNINTIGFNGILPEGVSFEAYNPLVLSGVSFSTPSPTAAVNVTTATFYKGAPYPADFIVDSVNTNSSNQLVMTSPAPTYAVGLTYGALGFRGPSTGNITLSNGFVLTLDTLPKSGQTQFAGFVSSTPITSLTYTVTNDDWVDINVLVGKANITLPNAIQGTPYAFELLEQGGVGRLTWTETGGTLPPGISLGAGGILRGIPTATGVYSFSVSVTDSSNPQKAASSGSLTITVAPQLMITTTSLQNGTEGVSYSAPISTSGGTPPIFFSVTQANFPPGLTITQPPVSSTSDTLAGTPMQSGVYTFTESVADSGNRSRRPRQLIRSRCFHGRQRT